MQNSTSLSDETRRKLVTAAQEARHRAYAPYSNYFVGAALLASNGEIIPGCNIENAAYSPTVCAERVAVFKAVSEGMQNFDAIAVVTSNGGVPCGVCRQVMHEFAPDLLVIIADAEGNVKHEFPLREILPFGFGPEQLRGHAAS
jgi:cytidine deaminase